jgi:hypothetical protein
MEHNMEEPLNAKLILCIFEQIDFHKSEVLCFRKAEDAQEDYRNIFSCELGPFLLDIWVFLFILES